MEQNMNAGQNNGPQQVVASAFAAKFETKGEIWRFLATEAHIYLPPYATVTIWHLKDIASGSKKVSLQFFLTFFIVHQLLRLQDFVRALVRIFEHGKHPGVCLWARLNPALLSCDQGSPEVPQTVCLQRCAHCLRGTIRQVGGEQDHCPQHQARGDPEPQCGPGSKDRRSLREVERDLS